MPNSKITFFIVEDNELDVEKIERAMKRLNISNPTVRAKDGQDALDQLRGTNGATKLEQPFVVLLDLNMPRMSGLEFLDEIRRDPELHSISVFVLTTSDRPKDIEDAHGLNISGYIVKPISRQQIVDALSTLNAYWELCEFPK